MAFDPLGLATDLTLDSPGHHKMRSGGDEHLYNPATIHTLQEATRRGDYELFKQYTALVNDENSIKNLRGLMAVSYTHLVRKKCSSRSLSVKVLDFHAA